MKQLKPQDAQFLFMEDSNLAAHVTSVLICDQSTAPNGIVRFKEILDQAEKRLRHSPLYSQKLMRLPLDIDFPYWVEDPHFEIENHVRHVRLPEPADWRQLCIQVARIHSRPMDMSRSPWEINIIEGLNNVENVPEGAFAMVIKLHHCAVDGTSAIKFLASMMDLGPTGPAVMPPPSGRQLKTRTSVSASKLLRRAAISNTAAPLKLARSAAKFAPALAREAATRVVKRKKTTKSLPKTRFNGDISPNRAFDGVSFDLEDFKKIARAFDGAKVNDVVLAVVGGALRKYLISKNELPKQSLKVTAPMNLRSKDQTSPQDDGNKITSLTIPIYTNIANPVDRLKSIVRASQAAKSDKKALGARMATDLSQLVPAPAISAISPLIVNSSLANDIAANAIVSNVPGFTFPVYFCGAKVTQTFALAPIGGGMGLFIATPSYNGQISFGITTTRQAMPDTPFFINCLRIALNELKSAAEKKKDQSPVEKTAPRRTGKSWHRTRAKGTSALKPEPVPVAAKPADREPHAEKPAAPPRPPKRRKTQASAKPESAAKPKAAPKAAAAQKKAPAKRTRSTAKKPAAPRKKKP